MENQVDIVLVIPKISGKIGSKGDIYFAVTIPTAFLTDEEMTLVEGVEMGTGKRASIKEMRKRDVQIKSMLWKMWDGVRTSYNNQEK